MGDNKAFDDNLKALSVEESIAEYAANADYKRYVDRNSRDYGKSVEETLKHLLVRYTGAMYREERSKNDS